MLMHSTVQPKVLGLSKRRGRFMLIGMAALTRKAGTEPAIVE